MDENKTNEKNGTAELADTPDRRELLAMLAADTDAEINALLERAYQVKLQHVGSNVHLRGLIEFSNVCHKNCLYCGIRKDNKKVERFHMPLDEIVAEARWIYESQYGSLVLQAGERSDEEFVDFVEKALRAIREIGNGELGVTISLGEQTEETYKRWFDAGAHRYLLRVESSNPDLYASIHPEECDFNARVRCLEMLRDIGYQVGTGVMIGLPGQTLEDLVDDILFFKKMDIDMVGMGPYIPHGDTPMAAESADFDPERQFALALRMIAATRITLKDVNIAAATALQALKSDGREVALKAGANVIMPNVTATEYRPNYQLYDNKPCLDENSEQCRLCLEARIASVGEQIEIGTRGDAPHFKRRIEKKEATV